MKKRSIITLTLLLILFTTYKPNKGFVIEKLHVTKIILENNNLLKEEEIKKILTPIYGKNIIFLNNSKIEKILMKNELIESFKLKKKYPDTLKIKIFEKKPIFILQSGTNRFYLSEKIDLIKFYDFKDYQDLPYVIGNKKSFKEFYNNFKKTKFPLNSVKKFIFYETNRWDLETKIKNNKTSIKNYKKV
jgi:cell division septal protein FtsQ